MPKYRSASRLAMTALLLLAGVSGCNSPTEPDDPIVYDLSTKTFTGSLAVGGSASFPFTVVNPGDLTVTITQLSPTSTLTMGIHLGSWDAATSVCTAQLTTNSATINVAFGATPSAPGDYCVTLFDIGNVQAATEFALRVTHY